MRTTPTNHKLAVMSEWAATLARGAHTSLDRMDSTLTRVEVKIAKIREAIARRDRQLGLSTRDVTTNA